MPCPTSSQYHILKKPQVLSETSVLKTSLNQKPTFAKTKLYKAPVESLTLIDPVLA